jgi:hypothetical protein
LFFLGDTKIFNIMKLIIFFEKIKIFNIHVQAATLKVALYRTMSKNKKWKKWKTKILWTNQTSFLTPYPLALGKFLPRGCKEDFLKKNRNNEFITHFEKITMGSYRVGIWSTWCFRKACEICNSLVLKKKLKRKSIFLSWESQCAQTAYNWFLVSKNLGVKTKNHFRM